MALMLLVTSGVALALLAVHCTRERELRRTLLFFIGGTLYGIARGNIVYYAYAYVKGCAPLNRPYVAQETLLPPVGAASLQVALGWVFALYLAFTVAELIVQRLPRLRGRVFVITALAGVFMLSICYCTETVAAAAGWWRWTLPTRSALFGNVNASAMWAWFTTAFEFVMPFLVIRRGEWRTAWVALVFVPHLMGHLFLGNFPNAYVIHAILALAVVGLMVFSPRRMLRGQVGEITDASSRRVSGGIFAAALAVFFAALTASSLLSGGDAKDVLTLVPMLLFCLLAWKRLPVWAAAVLSTAGVLAWPWVGPRALYALVPVACFGLLWLMDRLGEPKWLRLALTTAAVVAVVLGIGWERVDEGRAEDYVAAWRAGDALVRDGDAAAAVRTWQGARRFRPHETFRMYEAVQKAARAARTEAPPANELRERLSLLAGEYEELIRRDPGWTPPREELAELKRRLDETL